MMNPNARNLRMLALVIATPLSAPAAWCAEPPAPTPAPAPAPLRGPSTTPTAPRAEKPTLVHRDFNGKVVRLERTPEEAAAALLALDDSVRERIERIMSSRARVLDEFVARNLDLLTKLGQATAAGDTKDTLLLLGEAFEKLRDLRTAGTLEQQFVAVLPAERAAEFKGLIREYFDALVEERQADPSQAETDGQGKRRPPARLGIVIDERLRAFGKEIERAFYRSVYSGELLYQKIDEVVKLRPEQATRIRAWCAEFAEKAGMSPTEAQKRELFLKVLSALDAGQARQAIAYLKKNG